MTKASGTITDSYPDATSQVENTFNQLTHERVKAMRLMTNKLKKVAKVPVEIENQFCSHVDPATSAYLIKASDLNQVEDGNPFTRLWMDKEHKAPREKSFKEVPRHFYTSFKTNLIRDAHYMSRALAGSQTDRASRINDSCIVHGSSGSQAVKCGCKGHQV